MPNEQKIRQIVQEELRKSNGASRFGINSIPNHTHNGVDSLQIKQENIIPSVSVSGSIEMSQATTYRIKLNSSFTPSNILAYGLVTGTDATTVRAMTIGSAQLTPSFYLQTGTSTTVVTGNIQYPFPTEQPDGSTPSVPMQSSTYLSVEPTGAAGAFHALVSEDHLVSVFYSGTIWARATVVGFSRDEIVIDVPYLESGWSIILNFVIT